MRGGFAFGDTFWGVFLIVIGILALLRTALNIHFPLFRTVLGLFLIYLGISILTGGFAIPRDKNTVLFENRDIRVDTSGDYNVIFGRSTVDLTGLSPENSPRVEVDSIFADTVVRIKRDSPVRVEMSSAFASGSLPDGTVSPFGERVYSTPSVKQGDNYISVKANTVFGALNVVAE